MKLSQSNKANTETKIEKQYDKKLSIDDKRPNPHLTEKKSAFGKIGPKDNGVKYKK
jgi:hypothetical protein